MAEARDALTGRTTTEAELHAVGRASEVLPPLLDARVIQFSAERIVITGMERDITTRRDTAQAWLLVVGRRDPKGAGETDPH